METLAEEKQWPCLPFLCSTLASYWDWELQTVLYSKQALFLALFGLISAAHPSVCELALEGAHACMHESLLEEKHKSKEMYTYIYSVETATQGVTSTGISATEQ